MGLLRLAGFSGMWPARDPRALPDNASVLAVNVRAEGGAYLTGIRGDTLIRTLTPGTAQVFRLPITGNSEPLSSSFWMQFPDINTDVIRAPIVNDQHERIYWASPSTGLKYAPKASIIAGTVGLDVGVPAPTGVPVVAPVAGTGALDPTTGLNTAPKVTRDYLITYISEYGEESAPGPAYEVTAHVDQDWLVDPIPQPPPPGTRAAYQTIRLYRTVTGLTGVTAFYKVVDLPVGTTFYVDRLSDVAVTGNVLLATTVWGIPPAGFQGLASMANGIFVSWKDNNLFFSENYRPHAWPPEYMITVDFPIVGLGVFGSSCVVCTTGNPFVVSGIKANAMSLTKIDVPMPCLSRRSIVPTLDGVFYSTDVGLAFISSAGTGVVTADLITREQWRNDYAPATHKAMMIAGRYMAARAGIAGKPAFMFMPAEPAKEGVIDINPGFNYTNVGVEPWTGKPWYISGTNLREWSVPGAAPLSYTWRSREFIYPQPTNFSVGQLYFDDSSAGPIQLRIWATLRGEDGSVSKQLVYDQPVTRSGQELRLPSGFRSDVWQVEVAGSAPLQSLMLATTAKELRGA